MAIYSGARDYFCSKSMVQTQAQTREVKQFVQAVLN